MLGGCVNIDIVNTGSSAEIFRKIKMIFSKVALMAIQINFLTVQLL